MNQAKEKSRDEGYHGELWLHCKASNLCAQEFYEFVNFVKIQTLDNYYFNEDDKDACLYKYKP